MYWPEKSWVNFGSHPEHVLDIVYIIHFPVSQLSIDVRFCEISSDAAAFIMCL